MEYRQLGRTGTRVSELCLGTMTFGNEADEADEQADRRPLPRRGRQLHRHCERLLARRLGGDPRTRHRVQARRHRARDQGAGCRWGAARTTVGSSRRNIREQVEASLRRLGTDWIDLYQVHCWDQHTPLEETISTLNDLVREGKVRYIGASNFTGWHLAKALGTRARCTVGSPSFASSREYSLITRDIERELLPLVESEGLAVLPWSPLGGGVLSGKYEQGSRLPGRDPRRRDPEPDHVHLPARRPTRGPSWRPVGDLAAETGKTTAQVALNWVVNRPGNHRADYRGPQPSTQLDGQPRRASAGSSTTTSARRLAWASGFRLGYPYEFIQFAATTREGNPWTGSRPMTDVVRCGAIP